MKRRPIPLKVEVRPLPHLPSTRLGESSGSAHPLDDTAYATSALYSSLTSPIGISGDDAQTIYVAVEWPEDRRLAGKGKAKNLVVLVKPPPADLVSLQATSSQHLLI
jgi:hypothetical protein